MFAAGSITPPILIALLVIYLFGGFVKGAAAFGQPLMTIPLASFLLPVPQAIAITIAPVFVSNIVQLIQNRRSLSAARAYMPLYLSLAVTMIAGLLVLSSVGQEQLLVLIGVLILVFVIVHLTRWQPRIAAPMRLRVQILGGAISGLLGGMTSFVSFPVIPMFVACRLEREEFALLLCVMFLLAATILSSGLTAMGVYDKAVVAAMMLCVVPSAGGQVLGQCLRDRLPEVWLRLIMFTMLAAMGVSLLVRGLF